MNVFRVYLFVVRNYVDLEIATAFPLVLQDLDAAHFLPENSLAQHVSKQSLANVAILFESVHEVSQKEGEVGDEQEECPDSQPEHALLECSFFNKIILHVLF